MLSCWHDLLFLFCLLLFYLFLPSLGWLCVGLGLWTDRVFSRSPGFAQRTPINNDNNEKKMISAIAKDIFQPLLTIN